MAPGFCKGVTGLFEHFFGIAWRMVNLRCCLLLGQVGAEPVTMIRWVTVWFWGLIHRDLVQGGPCFKILRSS